MIFWSNRTLIRHLQDEVAYYRERLDLERKRAEMAIDELLRLRVGTQTVLAQPIPPSAAERARLEEFEKMVREPEFTEPTI